ncbi:P-loop containing nucleoside triphosphate hydrolase protein [Aspergillus spinulosporus]
MVAIHQDVNASPSAPQSAEQGFENNPLSTVMADLQALSDPATEVGRLPASPVCSAGSSTAALNVSELDKRLTTEAKFEEVLEIWDNDTCGYKVVKMELEADDFRGFVFVVRKRIDPIFKTSTTYIDVKSKTLQDILQVLLENVKAVGDMGAKLSIKQTVLFHFLPQLRSKLNQLTHSDNPTRIASPSLAPPSPADLNKLRHNAESRPEGAKDLRLLVNHIDEAYAASTEQLTPLLQRGEITYDLLELLFKPGCHLYTKCSGTGKPWCMVLDTVEDTPRNNATYFKLECHYVDHDGHEFWEVRTELRIAKFHGCKAIHTLEVFPLQYHPDSEQITRDLVERGQKFSQLVRNPTTILHYKGKALIKKNGKLLAADIDSRVGINAASFREIMRNYQRSQVSNCWEHDSAFISPKNLLTDDDYLICPPALQCFCLGKDDAFVWCAVSDLKDVQWSPVLFDRLQIPDKQKQILQSVVTARLSGKEAVDFDFIKRNGQGINVLLFGPPGVGKTFTAQAVAEYCQKPLHMVSAAKLLAGEKNPVRLEITLNQIFNIVKCLNMILLISEAELLIQSRALSQEDNQSLVKVFLQKLQSHNGILFLTANRVFVFDETVLSRIHLKLKYSELTHSARWNIWESCLAGTLQVTENELDQLASMKWNSHEIVNSIVVAKAMAAAEDKQVTFDHVAEAAKFNNEFAEFGVGHHL